VCVDRSSPKIGSIAFLCGMPASARVSGFGAPKAAFAYLHAVKAALRSDRVASPARFRAPKAAIAYLHGVKAAFRAPGGGARPCRCPGRPALKAALAYLHAVKATFSACRGAVPPTGSSAGPPSWPPSRIYMPSRRPSALVAAPAHPPPATPARTEGAFPYIHAVKATLRATRTPAPPATRTPGAPKAAIAYLHALKAAFAYLRAVKAALRAPPTKLLTNLIVELRWVPCRRVG
jgi:hypothetical protein